MARGWRRVLVCVIGAAFAYRGAVGIVHSTSRHEWWLLGVSALVFLFGLLGVVSILLPAHTMEH